MITEVHVHVTKSYHITVYMYCTCTCIRGPVIYNTIIFTLVQANATLSRKNARRRRCLYIHVAAGSRIDFVVESKLILFKYNNNSLNFST